MQERFLVRAVNNIVCASPNIIPELQFLWLLLVSASIRWAMSIEVFLKYGSTTTTTRCCGKLTIFYYLVHSVPLPEMARAVTPLLFCRRPGSGATLELL